MALWVSIFPADVCKSRIQVQAVEGQVTPTFRATITHIFKHEGERCGLQGLQHLGLGSVAVVELCMLEVYIRGCVSKYNRHGGLVVKASAS